MKSFTFSLFVYLLTIPSFFLAQDVPTFSPDDVDIPYQKFVLDNGLTLIVHEDHKAPIVAVNTWYHVGSKNEKPGKTGFAHLFEHLMFNGSENFNEEYIGEMESIGATGINGTTNTDRTNYFQNVPIGALDRILWLESDRMGHLLGAIDQAKLDEQRGVVQNEKRQGANRPYGRSFEMITKATYPAGHPYSWTVIGEMEDLNAASLEDVQEWFKTYYGAANAVLVVAGDVDTEEVLEKVKTYFGGIAPGPTLARQQVNIAKRHEDTRQYYQDRVAQARIHKVWNVPERGSEEEVYLDLVSAILSNGKNARLYQKLIYEDQSASFAGAFNPTKELGGQFQIVVSVKPGQSLEAVEKATNGVLAQFLEEGPTETELTRAKAIFLTRFIKGVEKIGGIGGKADILAQFETFKGNPAHYKTYLKTISEASVEDLHKAAKKWLSTGCHTLICEPFPSYKAGPELADRSQLPVATETLTSTFPSIEKASLKNGLQVVLAQRESVPTVVMQMIFDAGFAADQANTAGLANLSLDLLDEGTKNMDALAINDRLQLLGASITTNSDQDASYVTMNTLKPSLDMSLDLFAEMITEPAFPEREFQRLQKALLAQIESEKSQPNSIRLRLLPNILYGDNHAYSHPLTGSGYSHTVNALTRKDVLDFYGDWMLPNNAQLVVVGDISMDELLPKLEAQFGSWKKAKHPKKKIATLPPTKGNILYLVDRPEAQQSIVIASHLAQPYGAVNEIAREAMMNVFGGEFSSRLNMNLREDKHWSYGARGFLAPTKGQRPLVAIAPVQSDKTMESIQEMQKEIRWITGENPITSEEFEKTRKNMVLKLPGRWETNASVANSLTEMMKYELPEDYFASYGQAVMNLDLTSVQAIAKNIIHPDQFIWIVIGDKSQILSGLETMGFDQIIMLDSDGRAKAK